MTKLCLYATFARAAYDSDYEIGASPEMVEAALATLSKGWGTGTSLSTLVQNIPPEAMRIIARYERNACTPKMVEEPFAAGTRDEGAALGEGVGRRGPRGYELIWGAVSWYLTLWVISLVLQCN